MHGPIQSGTPQKVWNEPTNSSRGLPNIFMGEVVERGCDGLNWTWVFHLLFVELKDTLFTLGLKKSTG